MHPKSRTCAAYGEGHMIFSENTAALLSDSVVNSIKDCGHWNSSGSSILSAELSQTQQQVFPWPFHSMAKRSQKIPEWDSVQQKC